MMLIFLHYTFEHTHISRALPHYVSVHPVGVGASSAGPMCAILMWLYLTLHRSRQIRNFHYHRKQWIGALPSNEHKNLNGYVNVCTLNKMLLTIDIMEFHIYPAIHFHQFVTFVSFVSRCISFCVRFSLRFGLNFPIESWCSLSAHYVVRVHVLVVILNKKKMYYLACSQRANSISKVNHVQLNIE